MKIFGLIAIAVLYIVTGWIAFENYQTKKAVENISAIEDRHEMENLSHSLDKLLPHFDPNQKAYTTVDTQNGKFLIECEYLEPYSNGYKLHLQVGNPNLMVFKDAKVGFLYGSGKTAQSSIDVMNPGSWTQTEIVLSPAKPEDLDTLSVGITTDRVELMKMENVKYQ
jgi:hypothetical protein